MARRQFRQRRGGIKGMVVISTEPAGVAGLAGTGFCGQHAIPPGFWPGGMACRLVLVWPMGAGALLW
jgi:hypothetical protein